MQLILPAEAHRCECVHAICFIHPAGSIQDPKQIFMLPTFLPGAAYESDFQVLLVFVLTPVSTLSMSNITPQSIFLSFYKPREVVAVIAMEFNWPELAATVEH